MVANVAEHAAGKLRILTMQKNVAFSCGKSCGVP